jgi:hypothetical protein
MRFDDRKLTPIAPQLVTDIVATHLGRIVCSSSTQ